MRSCTIARALRCRLAPLVGVLLSTLLFAPHANAQSSEDPDLRNIEPFVMVMVDTSGSMERLSNCVCSGAGCTNCLPQCGSPATNATGPIADRKNRWGFTLEALTGQFIDFQCNTLTRTTGNGATYDLGYPIDYNQPWKCPGGVDKCAYPGTATTPIQINNGVLDTYSGSLRFGLMTFDGMETYQGANPLIHASSFNTSLSEAQAGMWSYGGPQPFHYPKCTEDYAMDTGARSSIATEGGLISVTSNACPSPPCSIYQINDSIQTALLRTRPFGGTPIAATLTDLFYHFKHDLQDPFACSRSNYGLLITDGYPDTDYREYGCDCKKEGNCPIDEDPDLMKCPYELPEDLARQLVVTGDANGNPPQIDQLFVIGISVGDSVVRAKLNLIASQGGNPEDPVTHDSALFAEDLSALKANLNALFSTLTPPVSRAVPTFATGVAPDFTQYRMTAGFRKALGPVEYGIAPPWTGIIERQRFTCTGTPPVPTGETINDKDVSSNSDQFHLVLNRQTFRRLVTALPPSPTSALLNGQLERNGLTAACGPGKSDYCGLVDINDVTSSGPHMSPALLGLAPTDTTGFGTVMDWMYGATTSVRNNKRLGDIYHSSPTVMRHGTQDATDSTYTDFLGRNAVAKAPLALYVGSNDGILHAFSVEAFDGPAITNGSKIYKAGEEMWGFVPPVLVDNLEAQLHSHQFGMDATPYIKDAFFWKNTGGTAFTGLDIPYYGYHTILLTGMRAGGKAYQALDISDPTDPQFLWQFTDVDMGYTYGKPVIAQLQVDYLDGATHVTGIRGVAILPGGMGTKPKIGDPSPPGCNPVSNTTLSYRGSGTSPYSTMRAVDQQTTLHGHRDAVPCWNTTGRALYFVDLETGHLIKKIMISSGSNLVFPSPLVGSPTVYPDAIGQVAKEGFVVDADGVIWRIDLSAKDPEPTSPSTGWTVRPFHDLYWGLPSNTIGETSYEVPILSVDDKKRLVVLMGTGDTDNFDKPAVKNRVVSLTEVVTGTNTVKAPDDYKAAFNWEMRDVPSSESDHGLIQSELVTGSMALFEGRLFFATFAPIVNATNVCQLGRGRVWSVHYNKPDSDAAHANKDGGGNNLGTKPPQLISLSGEEVNSAHNDSSSGISLFNTTIALAPENTMVFGLGATQLTCSSSLSELDNSSYFNDHLSKIAQSSPPSIWVVAQMSTDKDDKSFQKNQSALSSISVELNRPPSFSKVTSWAASTD